MKNEKPKDKIMEIAKALHYWYEQASDIFQWEIQKECRVSFDKLPDNNKLVMFSVAEKIYSNYVNNVNKTDKGLIFKAYKKGMKETTKEILDEIIKRIKISKMLLKESDFQGDGIEYSYSGKLIPVDEIELIIMELKKERSK